MSNASSKRHAADTSTPSTGMTWSGDDVPATHALASMRNSVSFGSSTSKSLKISVNFGITKYMMPVTMSTATIKTAVG